MNLLLLGIGFRNMGAELMLRAIRDHFQARDAGTMLSTPATGTFAQRGAYGLYTLLPRGRWGRSRMASALMPSSFRRSYGLTAESDVEAILDASGFAYSDQWGAANSRMMLENSRRWKAAGKKIILLPQAFGPFQNPDVREATRGLLDLADLVFARDEASMKHLAGLNLNTAAIKAPDFTGPVAGRFPEEFQARQPYACVAPNVRMLDKTDRRISTAYRDFLAHAIRAIRAKGLQVLVTTHEGGEDETLGRELVRESDEGVRQGNLGDVAAEKGVLGNAEFIVGSRFHHLVSGLVQGVPCLGAGWSHKYDELFAGYGCPEWLVSLSEGEAMWKQALDRALDPAQRQALRPRLAAAARVVQDETRRMWDQVDHVLFPDERGRSSLPC